jgi:hypothetical protein
VQTKSGEDLDPFTVATEVAIRQTAEAAEAQRVAWDKVFDLLNGLKDLTDLLLQGALMAEGYHQHHRGEWRRRRGNQSGSNGICKFCPGGDS